jgi:hypothetical protein
VNRNLDRVTVLDALLIAALLALPGWALVTSWRAAREQPVAYIYHNNRLLGAYQLDRDQVITISGDSPRAGTVPHMRIEIRGGAIRVAESDCPKGVCKQAGWVRTAGRSIVCVPNKVLIELRGERKGYDAESY